MKSGIEYSTIVGLTEMLNGEASIDDMVEYIKENDIHFALASVEQIEEFLCNLLTKLVE